LQVTGNFSIVENEFSWHKLADTFWVDQPGSFLLQAMIVLIPGQLEPVTPRLMILGMVRFCRADLMAYLTAETIGSS
jgi:hypothetical protein